MEARVPARNALFALNNTSTKLMADFVFAYYLTGLRWGSGSNG